MGVQNRDKMRGLGKSTIFTPIVQGTFENVIDTGVKTEGKRLASSEATLVSLDAVKTTL